MQRVLLLLVGVLAVHTARGISLQADITPWCDNSIRVRINAKNSAVKELPTSALINTHCLVGQRTRLDSTIKQNGNLQVSWVESNGTLSFTRGDTGQQLFTATASLMPATSVAGGFWSASLRLTAGNSEEKIYGLGQGNWSDSGGTRGGCAGEYSTERVVPLVRNGQTVDLKQRKFHVSIPFAYSTAGYGFLFNMPGYGSVKVGEHGGMDWHAEAAPLLDFWVTTLPSDISATEADPIYRHYADATGHAPMLREDAMIFWQSRLRYMNSSIALDIASKYQELDIPVGVLVIDYYNMVLDGDFQPDPQCYPSLKALSGGIRDKLNASTVFSIWPEARKGSAEFSTLQSAGCLLNPDLGGLGMDPTPASCRKLIWEQYVKPRYFDQGVTAFWLDETDGEGTGGGDGNFGYNTSYGPAAVATNLWVNDWLKTFTDPVAAAGVAPLALTRGTWAGGQRHGIVLWSSDIVSSFEELSAQVNLGVHASLSGIPWWTSDVGGFGCDSHHPNNGTYMQELIVRWYQFGLFCPIFRTHGCRDSPPPEPIPKSDVCLHGTPSCGGNEVWSYGKDTQAMLERYVRVRATELKPYIMELAANVTARGVPTMRPLAYEFPTDHMCVGIDSQYMLGPDLLVSPLTKQGATSREVYFPAGAGWRSFWGGSEVIKGGVSMKISAPLDTIPVYWRVSV